MHRLNLRRPRRAEGFTLIEVVVSVAILGIIAVALTNIVFQYLRTTGVTDARLRESTDEQFITTYWQTDVSGAGLRIFDTNNADPVRQGQAVFKGALPSVASGCGFSGSPLVSFVSTDFPVGATAATAWKARTVVVAYLTSTPVGASQPILTRARCIVPASGGGSIDQRAIVARYLVTTPTADAPAVSCVVLNASGPAADPGCAGVEKISTVSMTFKSRDLSEPRSVGYAQAVTVTADRRQG